MCLQPASKKLQLRIPHLGGPLITKVSFPVCSACYRKILPRYFGINVLLGWGLVALALAIVGWMRDTVGIVLFFVILLSSRAAKDYNPTGVIFASGKNSLIWTFPTSTYARLFYEANRSEPIQESPGDRGKS